MEPTAIAIASVLAQLISVGLKVSKAREVDGVGAEELETLKSVLDATGVASRLRSKQIPRPGALQLALTSQAFGFALARHWAGSTAMVPGSTLLPDRLAKWWKADEHARREEIEQRTRFAEVRLREPGNAEAGLGEIELVRALAGQPDATPYYRVGCVHESRSGGARRGVTARSEPAGGGGGISAALSACVCGARGDAAGTRGSRVVAGVGAGDTRVDVSCVSGGPRGVGESACVRQRASAGGVGSAALHELG